VYTFIYLCFSKPRSGTIVYGDKEATNNTSQIVARRPCGPRAR